MENGKFLAILLAVFAAAVIGVIFYSRKQEFNIGPMYMIFGVIVAVATGFIIYRMYKNEKRPKTGGSPSVVPRNTGGGGYVKINDTLDSEHEGIIAALDQAFNLSKSHGETEKKLFAEGQAKLCPGHSDVTKMWADHDQDHSRLLQKIVELKNEFINHIESFDKPHFHWINDQ